MYFKRDMTRFIKVLMEPLTGTQLHQLVLCRNFNCSHFILVTELFFLLQLHSYHDVSQMTVCNDTIINTT